MTIFPYENKNNICKNHFYHPKKAEIRMLFLESIKLLIKLNNKEIVKKANS